MTAMERGSKDVLKELPLIVSRELVVFPGSVVPFFTKDPRTVAAIERALEGNRLAFFAFPEKDKEDDEEEGESIEVFRVGTIVKILQVFRMGEHSVRIIGEAKQRGIIRHVLTWEDEVSHVHAEPVIPPVASGFSSQVMVSAVKKYFSEYASVQTKIPKDLVSTIEQETDPSRISDLIANAAHFSVDNKVHLLQQLDPEKRLQELAVMLHTEQELLKIQGQIQNKVRERIETTQKEYFLNEQIRQINRELGRESDEIDEIEDLVKRIQAKNPPEEVIKKVSKEASRLRKLQPMAPEAGVLRTYLEWIADLPWSISTSDSFDIMRAEAVLNEDHYNMYRPKERILDYMAVRSITSRAKGPILCFVGPPGTGKTSLGRSVARALEKRFVRISLGGVRDEAEIRGHRKTYVGALPGKIIQSIIKAGTSNPVFLLDEVDKLSSDFRGDPSSALLEVLDPEQNRTFVDHYLEVPYDLSQVFFIATANSLHTIPPALRDRMEVIEIPGYSDIEKYHIATNFLIPKQLTENGLHEASIRFRKDAIYTLIHDYTMESGVRNLERSIGSVSRKIAREYLKKQRREDLASYRKIITPSLLRKYLGNPEYTDDQMLKSTLPGVANGLAWTDAGGRLLTVEAVLMKGDGNLILTGSLGDVMKESARISYSYLESNCERYGIDPDAFRQHNVHVHVPQGAIPKDGPSAGITLTAAMASAFSGKSLDQQISMTGEVTLTGQVLRIGGVKEKLLASYRHGIFTVMMPEANRKDLDEDVPKQVLQKMKIIHVKTIDEALESLLKEPAPGAAHDTDASSS